MTLCSLVFGSAVGKLKICSDGVGVLPHFGQKTSLCGWCNAGRTGGGMVRGIDYAVG